MSVEAKRNRGLNFSPREVNHLFTIALQFKNTLENKKTNAITNSQKNEAWVKIAREFNATSSDLNNRTIEQLKRCYENKKQAMRKKKAQVRQEVLKTGGGLPPPEHDKKGEFDDLVLATMDPITVERHYNQFDSDVIFPIQETNSAQIEVFENSENAEENTILDNECSSRGFSEATNEENAEESTILDNECFSLGFSEATNEVRKNEVKRTEKTNWKNFNINDLKRPVNPALLQCGVKDKNEMQSMESEDGQVNDPAVVFQIEDQDANIKRNRGNGGGRGGTRGRGTPRKGSDRRRPTATLVRTLASNALAEKYECLADKKIIIADHTIKKMERERLHAEEEHCLRKECLQLDLKIKQKQLERLSR